MIARYVCTVEVIDPDTGAGVDVEVYKEDAGGMVGIDASFLDTDLPVLSPFDNGELELTNTEGIAL